MDSRNKKHADDCLRVVTKVVGTITEKGEEGEEVVRVRGYLQNDKTFWCETIGLITIYKL